MQVKLDPNLKVQKEDFGAVIDGDTLVMPAIVQRACQECLQGAVFIVGSLETFPSSWALTLGWTLEEVETARAKLYQMLEGKVPDARLHPSPPIRRVFGANPPKRRT